MHSYQLCSTALVQHFLILRRFAMASNLGTTCDMYHTKQAGTTTIVKTSFAIYIPMQLEEYFLRNNIHPDRTHVKEEIDVLPYSQVTDIEVPIVVNAATGEITVT